MATKNCITKLGEGLYWDSTDRVWIVDPAELLEYQRIPVTQQALISAYALLKGLLQEAIADHESPDPAIVLVQRDAVSIDQYQTLLAQNPELASRTTTTTKE